ncbi:hypothetical protein LTS10_013083 [Elasticomyces elasticus]|nr:hypothetical protein LTS10_013083 [Elasticomyces elasticus]
MQLKLNTRTKIALSAVMSVGYIASAAGAAKIYYLWHYFGNPDAFYHDWFFVTAGMELYLGILSASLPALKRLAMSFFASTRTYLSKSFLHRSRGTNIERRDAVEYQQQHERKYQAELKAAAPIVSEVLATDFGQRSKAYDADHRARSGSVGRALVAVGVRRDRSAIDQDAATSHDEHPA